VASSFYALKKELVDSGKMTYKQFHDTIMQQNSLPVDMIRAIMTNQKLTRDHKGELEVLCAVANQILNQKCARSLRIDRVFCQFGS